MKTPIQPSLHEELRHYGARDMEICMQCGLCSAACPLSSGRDTFPRKIYRYIQLGLRDRLRRSVVPWLCYYCGDCNLDCPRGAEPAETMMAARRWLTAEYDWTGLARRFYRSAAWEIGALIVVALTVVMLFVLGHGPVITDRVAVNSFAPVLWIEIGDLIMAAVLSAFLLSNAFRMFRFIMEGTGAPLRLYLSQARTFTWHFLTQKRWRKCGEDKSRWLKHFILVTGYLTMMTLVIVFIRWFQVDDQSWHFTSIFGYYATGALLFVTVEMFMSRLKAQAAVHRFSELSDWLFLVLLFFTTLTGILMHTVRLAGWPMGTYVIYVIHLAIAVPMLVVEVPFGKWSHLFYRPLAVYLAAVREKALHASAVDARAVVEVVGPSFAACLQCGLCTSVCPLNTVGVYNPRRILRDIALDAGSDRSVDRAVWNCLTCGRCNTDCPRGIDIVAALLAVRHICRRHKAVPAAAVDVLNSLSDNGNPWKEPHQKRLKWMDGIRVPAAGETCDYGLFACCTTAYDADGRRAGRALIHLFNLAGIRYDTLGSDETCCGDPAALLGAADLSAELIRRNTDLMQRCGFQKIVTTSPHCLHAFRQRYTDVPSSVEFVHYTELVDQLISEKRLRPTPVVDRTVTYHDPCYLGRFQGVYEAPRRILQSIPGLKLVEMAENRENALCCGAGGGGAWRAVDRDMDLAVLRVRQALDTGADVLVTACPFCLRMLRRAAAHLSAIDRLAVQDLSELLLPSAAPVDIAGHAAVHGDAAPHQEIPYG